MGGNFSHDLYHELVAKSLKANLLTETWQHTSKCNIGPSCTGYTVEDVSNVTVRFDNYEDVWFYNSLDHTKFAIGKTVPTVCIGDINRQFSQFHRGGGTMCFHDENVWKVFREMVTSYNACPEVLRDM